MTKMESFRGRVIISLSPSHTDDLSLSQHSFYTYMQQREFTGTYPIIVKHIQRVWEVRRKLTEQEFMEKFDTKLPQKPSGSNRRLRDLSCDSHRTIILPRSADMADGFNYEEEVWKP